MWHWGLILKSSSSAWISSSAAITITITPTTREKFFRRSNPS